MEPYLVLLIPSLVAIVFLALLPWSLTRSSPDRLSDDWQGEHDEPETDRDPLRAVRGIGLALVICVPVWALLIGVFSL